MDVRDAIEADADALATLSDSPVDVMRNLVHDRTVRVAVDATASAPTADDASGGTNSSSEQADETTNASGEGKESSTEIAGFVSFDARDETVYVTQIAGSQATCSRLLEEPIGFARREGMTVELLVPEGETDIRDAVEAAQFVASGQGPRFSGRPTTRYRLDPDSETASST